MDQFRFRVRSRPSLSLPHTLERDSSPVAILRMSLWQLRQTAAAFASSGDNMPAPEQLDAAVFRETVVLEDLSRFLEPARSRAAICRVLLSFLARSGGRPPVRPGVVDDWVSQVSASVSYSAAQAACVASCSVQGEIHIYCFAPETTAETGGGEVRRALLASRDAYDREESFGGGEVRRALLASRDAYDREESFGGGAAAAESSAIGQLETVVYEGEEDICAICQDDCFRREVSKTPCGHLFHRGCIVRWLQKSNKCPLCRFEMK